MASPAQDMLYLVLQFLEEEKLTAAAHALQRQTGLYLSLEHVEKLILGGNLDECEAYLLGFTGIQDNAHSLKMFFELRKTKYLEALDTGEVERAVLILRQELRVFVDYSRGIVNEITSLLALDDFRDNEKLKGYGDRSSTRQLLFVEVKKLIAQNPALEARCQLPSMPRGMLRSLVMQAASMYTLTAPASRASPPPLYGGVAESPILSQISGRRIGGSSQNLPSLSLLRGLMGGSTPQGSISLNSGGGRSAPGIIDPGADLLPMSAATAGWGSTLARLAGVPHLSGPALASGSQQKPPEGGSPGAAYPGADTASSYTADSLPTAQACTLRASATATSFDFHPTMHTLLLVGTQEGTVSLLALAQQEALFDIHCRTNLLMRDTPVNRVAWAPDGGFFGVAFAACKGKGVIHLYNFEGPGSTMRSRKQVNAHNGGVNDMAITTVDGSGSDGRLKLAVVTGGEDGTIRVWDRQGSIVHQTSGHTGPVLSICTHRKGTIDFIFSTGRDGRIKAWVYTSSSSRVDFAAPGRWCTSMMYSSDRTRLFSCGVSAYNGESTLVEWHEEKGQISRTYVGFLNPGEKLARFDTAANRFILAGDDSHIKVWDMDEPGSVLRVPLDAELPPVPLVKVNPAANLVAVSTQNKEIKVLASPDGRHLLSAALQQKMPPCTVYLSSNAEGDDDPPPDNSDNSSLPGALEPSGSLDKVQPDAGSRRPSGGSASGGMPRKRQKTHGSKSRLGDSSASANGNSSQGGGTPLQGCWGLARELSFSRGTHKGSVFTSAELCSDICHTVLPVETVQHGAIRRVLFTSNGRAILALTSTGNHHMWERAAEPVAAAPSEASDPMSAGWHPVCTSQMANQTPSKNGASVMAVPCLTLSNNDTYALSASGTRVELYNLLSKKPMAHFQPPPPATTSLAFSPQDNNIIALGLEDSTIALCNARHNTCSQTLKGHGGSVTGLAFSAASGALVSAAADAKVCIWGLDSSGNNMYDTCLKLQLESSNVPLAAGEVKVYFHPNQNNFLTVHAAQLAIHKASSAMTVSTWDIPATPAAASVILTDAVFSCDGCCVYASFNSGEIGVFKVPSLEPVCRMSVCRAGAAAATQEEVFPTCLAAHPLQSHASSLAAGLSDGSVLLLGLPTRCPPRPTSLLEKGSRESSGLGLGPLGAACEKGACRPSQQRGPTTNGDSVTYT